MLFVCVRVRVCVSEEGGESRHDLVLHLYPPLSSPSVAKFDLVADGLMSLSHRIFDHPTVNFIQTRLRSSKRRRHRKQKLQQQQQPSRHQQQPTQRLTSPTPSFDPSSLARFLGSVSLLTNQLVLRFEAVANECVNGNDDAAHRKRSRSASSPPLTAAAQLSLSCSEFSASLNLTSSSSSASSSASGETAAGCAFECLLSFFDLNSSLEFLDRRHQFFGPFHAQVSCLVNKGHPVRNA